MVVWINKNFFNLSNSRFFCIFMLFRFNFFQLFLIAFFILLVFFIWNIIIIDNRFSYDIFNWLLKVTLLVMLLNSKNSYILYFFLFCIRSLASIILFLVFHLIKLLGWNRLLFLDLRLLRLYILVIDHFVNFIFVVLFIFFSLPSFISVRQRWIVHVSINLVKLTLHCLFILIVLD